jgi:hypothetical protein
MYTAVAGKTSALLVNSPPVSMQTKMQFLQDPNQSSVDILNNVRCEASRHFRNKNNKNIGKLKLMILKPAVTSTIKRVTSPEVI